MKIINYIPESFQDYFWIQDFEADSIFQLAPEILVNEMLLLVTYEPPWCVQQC